jgi:hypothetical protein
MLRAKANHGPVRKHSISKTVGYGVSIIMKLQAGVKERSLCVLGDFLIKHIKI